MSAHDNSVRPSAPDFLTGGGEMGSLMRAHGWSASPLGEPGSWPQPLKTLVGVMLGSNQSMFVAWGAARTLLYNDAYAEILAAKHPAAMGRDFFDVWAEIRADLAPIVEQAYAGEPVHMDDIELVMQRKGYPEEAHFAFSYTPVRDEAGKVAGFFCPCVEITGQVMAERRRVAETARQRKLFEAAPGFIAILSGPDHVFEFTNEAYRRLVGGRDCVGKTVRQALPDLEGQGFFKLLDQVYSTGERIVAHGVSVWIQPSPDAPPAEHFLDFIYEPIADETGRATGIFVEGHDVTEAHRAREALRASEQRLRVVTNNARVGLVVVGPDHRYRLANQAYADILDLTSADIVGQRVADVLAPVYEAQIRPNLDRAFAGETVTYELVRSAKDGEDGRHYAVTYQPSADAGGTPIVIVIVYEVTDRVRAAAALGESEARYRALFTAAERKAAELSAVLESMPDAVYIGVADGITLANQPALDQLGFSTREELNRHVATLAEEIHTRDAETGEHISVEDQAFTRAFRGERVVQDVHIRHRLTGEERIVRCAAAPVVIDGQVIAAVAVNTDVTDARRAQEKLRELNQTLESRVAARTAELLESERRFRGIFDSALQFMALLAPDGTVQEVNQTALDWSEIEPDEIVGKPFWQAAPMRDNPALQAAIEAGIRRAASGETVRDEHEMRGVGDVRAIVDFSLKPVSGARGEPAWLVAEGRDVTELKRAQDALRQSQKMEAVGQLTGGIAHDFNNLLGAVVGAFDLIRRKPDDLAKVKKYAEAGLQAAERGAKLTGQLLAFSRSQRLELKSLVVSDLVTNMRELLARTLGPMVSLRLELDGDGAVLSDPTQLEMALLNLAINARDAMPDGGDLKIATAMRSVENDPELKAGDYIELAISDTGTGMPPEVAARAFDPFFTTKGVGKGTGLGLSQVYGIARQAGGTVRIDTRHRVGTTVRLYLPRTDVPAQPDAQEGVGDVGASSAAATVLVIDDDPDVRRMIVASLQALGHHTLEAADGLSGLELVEAEAPDLLMVDFAMPGMNGAEVARIAKERRPDLPIVFASGYADTAAIEAAAGPDAAVLRKPFRVDDLQAVLAEALPGRN